MAKDKKAKKAEQKARVAVKQSKKAAKGEKKAKTKANQENDSDAENVDLDAVLASYAEQQAQYLKVTEQVSEPPSPRSSATFVASPSNRNELFLFGGEFYDGTLAVFYNNLYIYLIDRGEWREITSPNSPLPRSGHAWCRGGNQGGIYMFGGEFSSPKQGTFYHYNDFWHLDTATREWSRLEVNGKSPPARSGHRMTYFKNYILLTGGFQDTSQQTKYLQDLWIYDCGNFVWHNPTFAAAAQKPEPRSSCSLLPHESGAVLYGGYSRVKAVVTAGKAKHGPQKNLLKPCVHQDTWFLRLSPPSADAPVSSAPNVRWERRKRPVNSPNPARAGATMAYHKGRGLLFGGVHDVENSEEGIESEFFNILFVWNIDRNRFFQLTLRQPRIQTKRQPLGPTIRGRNRGKADEEELLRNLAQLETKGAVCEQMDDAMDIDVSSSVEPEPEALKFAPPVRFEMPHSRFNTQMTVQDDVLYLFGGTFERVDQEFTFNDMYSIDLGKMDGVRELLFREPENWNSQIGDESNEESDDDEGSESEEMDEDQEFIQDSTSVTTGDPIIETSIPTPDISVPPTEDLEPEVQVKDDLRPYPRPFESLRDFFARSSEEWQNIVIERLKTADPTSASLLSVKEIRKTGFDLADERWWDCREEIQALEDEQEEAGIGEIISMKDRASEASGPGRRR